MADSYLDKVYEARGSDATRELYDEWAKAYDADLERANYATPGRCAAALHAIAPDKTAPILDFGCGTGLSGLAFRMAGFTTIDGCDMSEGMIEEAREKGVYRNLTVMGADDPVPEGYSAIAAVGVIGAGAAPAEVFDRIVAALPKGGMMVFSFNDHTLEDPNYMDRLAACLENGTLIERFREHGPHLPERDLNSTVYVLEKA